MSTPKTKNRALAILLALAALGLLAAGCGDSGEPEEYNATVEENYVKGCELAMDESQQRLTATKNEVCKCAYAEIKDNIAFEDFKKVDDELRENINALDSKEGDDTVKTIREHIKRCIQRYSQA